jgi:chorismate mutase
MSAWLQRRIRALSEEIRSYPTPIARCDEQLPALLEERAQLMQELGIVETPACNPLALWANDGGSDAA